VLVHRQWYGEGRYKTYDRDGRNNLQKVRCQALEESTRSLMLQSLPRHIHNTGVGPRMASRALTLQPRPQQVERIDDAGAKRTTEPAHQRKREITRQRVLVVLDTFYLGVPCDHFLLQRLEHEQVDRSIREHSHQTHGQSAVERHNAIVRPHLSCSVPDELVAALAADDSFALHAELERIQRVYDSLTDHASHATRDEL
jgi:hypothetical protein